MLFERGSPGVRGILMISISSKSSTSSEVPRARPQEGDVGIAARVHASKRFSGACPEPQRRALSFVAPDKRKGDQLQPPASTAGTAARKPTLG